MTEIIQDFTLLEHILISLCSILGALIILLVKILNLVNKNKSKGCYSPNDDLDTSNPPRSEDFLPNFKHTPLPPPPPPPPLKT